MSTSIDKPRAAALLILAGSAATIAAVFVFQYGLGYPPCQLCLYQRLPYYAAIPMSLAIAAMPPGKGVRWELRRMVWLGLLALVFLVSIGLGVHHAGVEWQFWAGPAGCSAGSGTPVPIGDSVDNLMKQLQSVRVVSCTEAAWRFLGLSMAGWNAVVSAILTIVAWSGARIALRQANSASGAPQP